MLCCERQQCKGVADGDQRGKGQLLRHYLTGNGGSFSADQQHRFRGDAHHALGDAAQEQVAQSPAAMCADHDKVCRPGFGICRDHFRDAMAHGVDFDQPGFDRYPGASRHGLRLAEDFPSTLGHGIGNLGWIGKLCAQVDDSRYRLHARSAVVPGVPWPD